MSGEEAMSLPMFEKFEKNEEWFSTQFKETEKYRDKFLAVVEPGVIIADDDLERLMDKLEKRSLISSAFITAIPKKGVASIL